MYELSAGDRVHLVGIGGVGMSGLAQLLAEIGCEVSGSDRASGNPENRELFDKLRALGIKIYPQDGSFASDGDTDCVVYSTAVEPGNPDFAAAPGLPTLHRSDALRRALELYAPKITVAVSGSSGKTSVTAYLAELLTLCGVDAGCLNGGMVRNFVSSDRPGNFRPGREVFVFEADESDKSLLNYSVDYAMILNIGCDHYPQEVLAEVFGEFSRHVRRGLVLASEVSAAIAPYLPAGLPVLTFSGGSPADRRVTGYFVKDGRASAEVDGEFRFELPQPGFHTALNAAAVGCMAELLGKEWREFAPLFSCVGGAHRRFGCMGRLNGAPLYDDYAHNPQKLGCCIKTAQELAEGRVFVVWQPHGYGPLGFMRDELKSELTSALRPQDLFMLLEPYYAGGTSSFKPHASEVVDGWALANVVSPADRAAAAALLRREVTPRDIVLVCGARDNTLPQWALELTSPAQAGSEQNKSGKN